MKTKLRWQVYRERFKDHGGGFFAPGDWRWRCKASNGRIVGAATQGYSRRIDCVRNARLFGYQGNVTCWPP